MAMHEEDISLLRALVGIALFGVSAIFLAIKCKNDNPDKILKTVYGPGTVTCETEYSSEWNFKSIYQRAERIKAWNDIYWKITSNTGNIVKFKNCFFQKTKEQ